MILREPYEIMREYMIRPKGMFIWRDIPDYEGTHQISNHGEVRAIWNKPVSENYSSVVLMDIEKRRQFVSRNKLLKAYWKESERYTGEERWHKLDHYGEYYVSNYANVKNCRVQVLSPTNGMVVLIRTVDGKQERATFSVLKLFLNTFCDEIFIDHEKKEVNYIKKNENISDSSLQIAS